MRFMAVFEQSTCPECGHGKNHVVLDVCNVRPIGFELLYQYTRSLCPVWDVLRTCIH